MHRDLRIQDEERATNRHRRLSVRSIVALATFVAVVACGTTPPSAPPTPPGPSPTPQPRADIAPGALHLTGIKDFLPHSPLTLTYLASDNLVAAGPDFLLSETSISLDRPLPAGDIRVVANKEVCLGALTIASGMEVDAEYGEFDGCRVNVIDTHPIGSIAHPQPHTAINAMLPVDAELVVRSLDPLNPMADIRLPSGPRGEIEDVAVKPGRYELFALVGGEVLTSKVVDVKRGQRWVHNLRVLSPDVPRDCGTVNATDCEAAIAEAYAWGLFIESGQDLRSVEVRHTKYGACDGNLDNRWDLTFEVRPVGNIEVTVGVLKHGGLAVCTY